MAQQHLMFRMLVCWGCGVLASQQNSQLMLMMLAWGRLGEQDS